MFEGTIGPILIILFTGLLAWSIFGYLQNDLYPLLVGASAELFICFIFGWSTGKLLVLIPLIQIGVAGYIIFQKIKKFKVSVLKKSLLNDGTLH